MKKVTNFLVALGLITPLVMGAINAFAPLITFEKFGLQPLGIMGYSTFRGLNGGMLMSAGLIMLMGLITKNKTWYQASLLMVSVILICRVVSIVLDGWTNKLIPVLIAESFNLVVLSFALKQFKNKVLSS